MEEQYIKVPASWLERLLEISESEDGNMKVAYLIGYISSAKTLLKYNKIDDTVSYGMEWITDEKDPV